MNQQFLASLLICPQCHHALRVESARLICRNGDCRHCYPVLSGIPVLRTDVAEVLEAADWQQVLAAGDAEATDG